MPTFDEKSAARRRKFMRAVNVPMRFVLSMPFRTPLGSRLMLVNYTGRKSGQHYRQPVSYVREAGVLLSPGGGNWTLSLADGKPVTARIAGKDVSLRPELVVDPTEVDTLLMRMAELNPTQAKFVPIPRGEDGHFETTALNAAISHGFCVVRWCFPQSA